MKMIFSLAFSFAYVSLVIIYDIFIFNSIFLFHIIFSEFSIMIKTVCFFFNSGYLRLLHKIHRKHSAIKMLKQCIEISIY